MTKDRHQPPAVGHQQIGVYAEGVCSRVATALRVVDAYLGEALWPMADG